MDYAVWFPEELPLNHEPSLNQWAHLLACDEMKKGGNNYDYEYEQAWHYLDAAFNYTYEFMENN